MQISDIHIGRRHSYIDSAQFNDEEIIVDFLVRPEMPVLAGHFPGNPIVPGVVQGQMLENASRLLLKQLGHPNSYANYFDGIKFKHPILPGAELEIHAKILEKNGDEVKIKGWIVEKQSGAICAAGKVRLKIGDEPELVTCDNSAETSVQVSQQEIADYIPHGPEIRFCDEITKIRWSKTTQDLIDSKDQDKVTFPDLVGSVVFSRAFADTDRHLMDFNEREELVLPNSSHVEISAQSGIFMIWGIKPDDVEIETILLGYSLERINSIPSGTLIENRVELIQSRGSMTKGYMNFFNAEISCGDIVFSKIKYSAICTYIK